MNLGHSDAGPGAPRHIATVNRRKARVPKRAASGDDVELFDRHRQEVLPDQPRPQPQHRLFQGRAPQSLAGMRRLKNAPPPQVLEGKRTRHASTWLTEFVKDLPQSPAKIGERMLRRGASKERSPSPLQPLNGAQSLGPPNAEFLGLGPVPKKRRSAGGGFGILAAVKPEDSMVNVQQGAQVPDEAGEEHEIDPFTALRHALHVQHGKPQVWVKADHVQQLLDTLKAFQALLGCQGIAALQGKLHPALPDAAALRLSAGSDGTAPQGAEQTDSRQEGPRVCDHSLQQLLRSSSMLLASQPARDTHHTGNATDASLPPSPGQHTSLASFQQPGERYPSSAACNGISVPVQQSLPHIERHVQAENCMSLAGVHPGSAVLEDPGQAPSCRPVTRSARSPADKAALLAG